MTAKSDGGNRTRPCTGIYRAVMEAIEARRLERGLSMSTVNDISGLNDGFYSKMIYPDTPTGRQARWETVQLAIEALFGKNFTIQIIAQEEENRRLTSAPVIDESLSSNARQIRHWRHRTHFQKLGRLGGLARAKLGEDKLSAIASKAQRKRWKRVRQARRQGEAHKAANAEKRV